MSTVSLRRTKEQNLIVLPSKSVETHYVELSQEERDLYDRMEEEAKQVVGKYINDGTVTRNYSTVLSIILRLRQICTDVALCPHDIKSLVPPDNVQGCLSLIILHLFLLRIIILEGFFVYSFGCQMTASLDSLVTLSLFHLQF